MASVCTLTFILLLALKLTGLLVISWAWVFFPLIIGPIMFIFVLLFGLIIKHFLDG